MLEIYYKVCKTIKKLQPNKAPEYDLITGTILKRLSSEGITYITCLYNAVTNRLLSFSVDGSPDNNDTKKNPGKNAEDPKSYRPISLLPIPAKLFESLLLIKLLPEIEEKQLIPSHQFGFQKKHSTIDQIHRIVAKINKAFESRKFCSAVFLDIS